MNLRPTRQQKLLTMNWRDLLYFSKGERRALTVLLGLITLSWTILSLSDEKAISEANRDIGLSVHRSDSAHSVPISPKSSSPKKNKTFQKRSLSYTKKTWTEKYPAGTHVELNTADTTSLKKVPGIGSTFSRRIVKYRELLGGFYTVDQLRDVYGIDEDRFLALRPWFYTDSTYIQKLEVNRLPASSLRKHPYINYEQARTLEQLRKQKGRLSGWENLQLLEEFTEKDTERLKPYLSFE